MCTEGFKCLPLNFNTEILLKWLQKQSPVSKEAPRGRHQPLEAASPGLGSREDKEVKGAGMLRHTLGSWGQADAPHHPTETA